LNFSSFSSEKEWAMLKGITKELFWFCMEALALLIAILAFLALLAEEIKPPPPSAGDQFVKGLKAVAKDVTKDVLSDLSKGSGGGGSKNEGISPWTVMALAVLFGFLLMYVR
jgi:hypothetical protein